MPVHSIACGGFNLSSKCNRERNECSPPSKLVIPKEEKRGKERKKERVRAEHRRIQKVRV